MYLSSVYATAYARKIGVVFSGCKNGKLLLIEDDSLSQVGEFQAHDGVIEGMAICEERNLIGMIGTDRHISLFKYDENTLELTKLLYMSTRDAGLDDHSPFHSASQAFDINPNKNEIATRSGNSSLVFIDFEGNVTHKLRLHGSDIATVKYSKCGNYLLAGGIGGEVTVVSNYETKDHVIPDGIDETMHWFEEVSKDHYLVACDARKIISITVDPETLALSYSQGDLFTRDDLEHVTYKAGEKFALATSFDRNIYKIDIETLQNIGVCFEASYKMRWIDYHRAEENSVLVQVRDGSLLKVDIGSGKVLKKFHEMPPTIWSCDLLAENNFIAVGEQGLIAKLSKSENSTTEMLFEKLGNVDLKGGYFKRVCSDLSGNYLAGSTTGLLLHKQGEEQNIIDIGSPVRDICYSTKHNNYFISLEDGRVVKFEFGDLTTLWESDEPIWSLAISPDNNLLSFGERMGKIRIMDIDSEKIIESSFSRLPKRMKWADNETLYFTHSDSIDKISLSDEGWEHHHRFIDPSSNTVEDFVVWGNYILMITYTNRLWLADTGAGTLLDSAFYGPEYMKSISVTGENHFTLMGRSGSSFTYKVDCDQLLPVGIQWYKDDI